MLALVPQPAMSMVNKRLNIIRIGMGFVSLMNVAQSDWRRVTIAQGDQSQTVYMLEGADGLTA